MATEYSLITPFGKGVTATMTIASPCVVTIPSGTVLSNGNPVVFTTTGALPTGITAGTTYYSRWVTDNTYHLYDTKAHAQDTVNTTGRVDTSGSQSGTHTIYGGYWYNLPATDPGGDANYRARYGSAGSERVYTGIEQVATALAAKTTDFSLTIYVEVEGKFTDKSGYSNFGANKFYSIIFASLILGVRSSAFHNGLVGGGYKRLATSDGLSAFYWANNRLIIDGLEGAATYNSNNQGAFFIYSLGGIVRNCIASGSAYGFRALRSNITMYNNIAFNCSYRGFELFPGDANDTGIVFNNLAYGCGVGFSGINSRQASFNNVAVGCTTNWGTAPTNTFLSNNAGATGDTIWGTASVSGITSASFVDAAGGNLNLATGSALIDAGVPFQYMEFADIVGAVRPSYKNGDSTQVDIGPFEYDWGYGLAPLSVPIQVSGIIEGSEMAIYNSSAGAEIVAPTAIGSTGIFTQSYSYTGDVPVKVVVRKGTSAPKYQPYIIYGTISASGLSAVVSQVPDAIAELV